MNNEKEIEFLKEQLYWLKIASDEIKERFILEHRAVSIEYSTVQLIIDKVKEHLRIIENEKEEQNKKTKMTYEQAVRYFNAMIHYTRESMETLERLDSSCLSIIMNEFENIKNNMDNDIKDFKKEISEKEEFIKWLT